MDPSQETAATLEGARRLVVKVGSSSLSRPEGGLDEARMARLVERLVALRRRHELVLVSSGAVAAGRDVLPDRPPQGLREKQALAAVGQGRLIQAYEELFRPAGVQVAQVLLTRSDVRDRRRYLNTRLTLITLLAWGVLPIVNENDTVAVEEIRLGDNDTLSALVAILVDADLLLMLSDVDGLYEADPRRAPGARRLATVARIGPELLRSGGSPGPLGSGGIATKLEAARLATRSGVAAALAHTEHEETWHRLLAGRIPGTYFPARGGLSARKRWIVFHDRPRGWVQVDAGAQNALLHGGKSLLPVGVTAVGGSFGAGDLLAVLDGDGREIARGLVTVAQAELEPILALEGEERRRALAALPHAELIHRDNLVLMEEDA
ncbi:glutamate 5-kinase [Limnochorda pilosa]|uniref:Glutamate 5-kinase n=1 Tax=Limnochorda pilosa TaxID=1555112 RepID=A0A0K2SIK3_LIMPI|nr:glutamate 5-kinase [Limnochorda pilosa]BAS26644.1 gamma-glutamyl kinase [Limnochorda pilosa]